MYAFYNRTQNELDILFKELLIGVTNFFRDAAVWIKLKEKVFPDLFNELPNGYVLRAWITGCSTGEEAYSLAIIFKEAYEKVKSNKNFSLQIFATDIDSDAIEKARKGFFSQNILADISSERINHFFTKAENGYFVNTSIREMIVFAPHNVIKDPPFTKLDFLLCRNLLIYMEPELQKKLSLIQTVRKYMQFLPTLLKMPLNIPMKDQSNLGITYNLLKTQAHINTNKPSHFVSSDMKSIQGQN